MDAPGPFFFLVRDGALSLEQLAPLLARLPPEEYVRTAARDSEALDSKRWPVARDAALATAIALRFADPAIARTLAEIEACGGDRGRLRALAHTATARVFAASGLDASTYTQWSGTAEADLAVFAEPPWPALIAQVAADLCNAHHGAAEGLFAYHVHRRLPGFAAEAAARLARRALADGLLDPAALVTAAIELVART